MDKLSQDVREFEKTWFLTAQTISERIAKDPRILVLAQQLKDKGHLSPEDRSLFISIADTTKEAVLHEQYGTIGSEKWQNFVNNWRQWFNDKSSPRFGDEGKQLSNPEHIAYSSTPDPDSFLRNLVL